ncbi:hypothetical protein [Vibrio superstes]|uniref:Uncharacterized protein n=1 Tax=Vibrio superstes NBRC 103154 TaxID=1219062 RepID=A0A511QWJ8_9VIBR|nr:hypothetical protein [Vibrio superstes]GEM81347.1 hypothetical protein VSU01S_35920 [Vibrio superstes NBRC 103154]
MRLAYDETADIHCSAFAELAGLKIHEYKLPVNEISKESYMFQAGFAMGYARSSALMYTVMKLNNKEHWTNREVAFTIYQRYCR